jgi:hypothetical protein
MADLDGSSPRRLHRLWLVNAGGPRQACAAMVSAPAPAPEIARLECFTGAWLVEAEMRPSAFNLGGRFEGTNAGEWALGAFYVLVRVEGRDDGRPVSELELLGYDAREKIYTYDAFNSLGGATHLKGRVSGEVWIWEAPAGAPDDRVRVACLGPLPVRGVRRRRELDGGAVRADEQDRLNRFAAHFRSDNPRD